MHQVSHRLQGEVTVFLVGCGGTGSQILTGLGRLHTSLLALGHRHGLKVVVYDEDNVSEANVGRQLFYPQDVGQNKATVLVTRVNAAFGTRWQAMPCRFTEGTSTNHSYGAKIVIGCVDTRASRRAILGYCRRVRTDYWLDLGNRAGDGQVVLGEPLGNQQKDWHMRLPTVVELFPSVLDEDAPEDDLPSCSLAEALEKQELFINQGIATHGLQLLWTMFRRGVLDHSVIFVNLNTGRVNPLPIDREVWKRFGHRTYRKPPQRKMKSA